MSSHFKALFAKEFLAEIRNQSAWLSSALFGLSSIVAIAFSTFNQNPTPTQHAGMLTIVLVFAATVTLPRVFMAEEEQQTFDFLRLIAKPEAIWLGKAAYCTVQMVLNGLVLALLYSVFTKVQVVNYPLYFGATLLEAISLGVSLSLCGSIALGASSRWLLTTVIALPLVLPQIAISIGAIRPALGEGSVSGGIQNLVALLGFAIAMVTFGPPLSKVLWKLYPGEQD